MSLTGNERWLESVLKPYHFVGEINAMSAVITLVSGVTVRDDYEFLLILTITLKNIPVQATDHAVTMAVRHMVDDIFAQMQRDRSIRGILREMKQRSLVDLFGGSYTLHDELSVSPYTIDRGFGEGFWKVHSTIAIPQDVCLRVRKG